MGFNADKLDENMLPSADCLCKSVMGIAIFVIEDAKIRIYGILAIINGIFTYERSNPDGSLKITRLKYTSAYAKSDGDWNFVNWKSLIMSP